MKLFECQCCDQPLYFENTTCLRCGRTIGYLPQEDRMIAVEPDGPVWFIAAAQGGPADDRRFRFCHNWELSACNWMVRATVEDAGDTPEFCEACRHNRTVPDLSDPPSHARWQRIEAAKRRLVYGLMHLGLPRPAPDSDYPEPLVFDFLADNPGSTQRVLTGHASGVVTIALVEADDAAREKIRSEMGEGYRTLLGHFRHEVGHYYWDLLVRGGSALDAFRAMFGDERTDYATAVDRHYREGAPSGWQNNHVSAYATMHPWEDWAETWAHYMHITDALETAAALGLKVEPGIDEDGELSTEIDFDPYSNGTAERLLDAWAPMTIALNMLNRSMGLSDLYPFILPEPVRRKVAFVHDLVRALRGGQSASR